MAPTTLTPSEPACRPWQDFARMSEVDLGRQDIAEVYLSCAEGAWEDG